MFTFSLLVDLLSIKDSRPYYEYLFYKKKQME
jgi:hypothetical protein